MAVILALVDNPELDGASQNRLGDVGTRFTRMSAVMDQRRLKGM